MTTDLSDAALIAEAERLDREATPGPWEDHWTDAVDSDFDEHETVISAAKERGTLESRVVGTLWYDGLHTCVREGDAAFIAHARQLLPELARRLRERNEQLNAPELRDFREAVLREAAHQRARWGSDHDGGKTPADWFWLIGYLAGKCLHATIDGRTEKALHHAVTAAAALANWHAAILGKTNMRPGILPPDHDGTEPSTAP